YHLCHESQVCPWFYIFLSQVKLFNTYYLLWHGRYRVSFASVSGLHAYHISSFLFRAQSIFLQTHFLYTISMGQEHTLSAGLTLLIYRFRFGVAIIFVIVLA